MKRLHYKILCQSSRWTSDSSNMINLCLSEVNFGSGLKDLMRLSLSKIFLSKNLIPCMLEISNKKSNRIEKSITFLKLKNFFNINISRTIYFDLNCLRNRLSHWLSKRYLASYLSFKGNYRHLLKKNGVNSTI